MFHERPHKQIRLKEKAEMWVKYLEMSERLGHLFREPQDRKRSFLLL